MIESDKFAKVIKVIHPETFEPVWVAKMNDGVKEWLEENKIVFSMNKIVENLDVIPKIEFDNIEDEVAFKLRWL